MTLGCHSVNGRIKIIPQFVFTFSANHRLKLRQKQQILKFSTALMFSLLLAASLSVGAPVNHANQTSGLGVINGRTTSAGSFVAHALVIALS